MASTWWRCGCSTCSGRDRRCQIPIPACWQISAHDCCTASRPWCSRTASRGATSCMCGTPHAHSAWRWRTRPPPDTRSISAAATPTRSRSVAEMLAEAMGAPELAPRLLNKARAGDIRHCFADIGKARDLLGYQPEHLLEESLDELVQWIRAIRRARIAAKMPNGNSKRAVWSHDRSAPDPAPAKVRFRRVAPPRRTRACRERHRRHARGRRLLRAHPPVLGRIPSAGRAGLVRLADPDARAANSICCPASITRRPRCRAPAARPARRIGSRTTPTSSITSCRATATISVTSSCGTSRTICSIGTGGTTRIGCCSAKWWAAPRIGSSIAAGRRCWADPRPSIRTGSD